MWVNFHYPSNHLLVNKFYTMRGQSTYLYIFLAEDEALAKVSSWLGLTERLQSMTPASSLAVHLQKAQTGMWAQIKTNKDKIN